MSRRTTDRWSAILLLAAGLTSALTGCGSDERPTEKGRVVKAKKSQKAPADAGPTEPTSDAGRPAPAVDADPEVGRAAVEFLTKAAAGEAKAGQLSAGFLRAIGRPVELPGDRERGYSPDAAESWLRRVGLRLSGIGPMTDSLRAGDAAVFRGRFTGGTYFLRMVQESGGWKADWLSLTSVEVTGPAASGPSSADGRLQDFVAVAVAAAVCDQEAMPREERIGVIAVSLAPALRAAWADPFAGDLAKGYDYSPAKLGLRVGEIARGAEAVAVARTTDAVFTWEVTRQGGIKDTYTVRLVRGPTSGQWLVESLTR